MDILAYCAVIGALFLLASIVDLLRSCLKEFAADSGHAAHQSACGAAEGHEGGRGGNGRSGRMRCSAAFLILFFNRDMLGNDPSVNLIQIGKQLWSAHKLTVPWQLKAFPLCINQLF